MVENLKLPLCKEKRSCYLNTKSASAAVKKKKKKHGLRAFRQQTDVL